MSDKWKHVQNDRFLLGLTGESHIPAVWRSNLGALQTRPIVSCRFLHHFSLFYFSVSGAAKCMSQGKSDVLSLTKYHSCVSPISVSYWFFLYIWALSIVLACAIQFYCQCNAITCTVLCLLYSTGSRALTALKIPLGRFRALGLPPRSSKLGIRV